MFVNKLNQLYKPKRILYYIDATSEEIADFCMGNSTPSIIKYKNSFGVYDTVGLFYIAELNQIVIGIEFRLDDERIEYPTGLKSVILDEAFFYSIEIDNEIRLDKDAIHDIFAKIAADDDAHRAFSDLSIKEDAGVVGAFPDGKKVRILFEWKLNEDRAQHVINDDYEVFAKEYLYKNAFTDPVTGHYNWNHLEAFLEMPQDRGIKDYSFVHFDVKSFRVLNEVYGHIAANQVLKNIVKAMNEADFVYASGRCHNDNFAMMIKDMPEKETIEVLEKFFDKLSYLEDDPNYRIFYRCGVVLMPRSLLAGNRVADAAKMAQALGGSPNKTQITVYSDNMYEDVLWGNYIKAYVETAIKNDEFMVYLQPKFDSRTNMIKGSEALIRWNYKKKELLSPSRFIPFFEKDGSIGKIDDIVLEKVCMALSRWKHEGKMLYPISVNLSRNRMYDKNIISHLTEIVDRYDIDHKLIDFELTESASYDNTEHMINILHGLRQNGFKISMDDFGTGYSSLSLLTSMPIDTLKIDKSFIDKIGIGNEKEADIIVLKHIITMAANLGFVCLAEGAERKEQVVRLSEIGCDMVQGYFFSKPLPMDEFDMKYLCS